MMNLQQVIKFRDVDLIQLRMQLKRKKNSYEKFGWIARIWEIKTKLERFKLWIKLRENSRFNLIWVKLEKIQDPRIVMKRIKYSKDQLVIYITSFQSYLFQPSVIQSI